MKRQMIVADGRRPKASGAALLIPEEIQRPWRERLRLLRVARRKRLSDFTSASSSSMTNWEIHDLSTARLGNLIGLANEYHMTYLEFFSYLFGPETDVAVPERTRRVQRSTVMLLALPDEMQEAACDILQRLVDYHVASRIPPVQESSQRVPRSPARRSSTTFS